MANLPQYSQLGQQQPQAANTGYGMLGNQPQGMGMQPANTLLQPSNLAMILRALSKEGSSADPQNVKDAANQMYGGPSSGGSSGLFGAASYGQQPQQQPPASADDQASSLGQGSDK